MKFIVYGLLYVRGAASIAKQTGLSKSEVEQQINGFFRTFPGVKRHLQLLENLVKKQNFLRNPFDRRRWWFTRMLTEMANFLPSSTAADMMYLVLPKLENQLPIGATLRLTVHDEIDVICLKEQARVVTECIRDIMQAPFPEVVEHALYPDITRKYYPNGFTVPVDITYGNNWKQCKPDDADKEWQAEFQKSLGVA